jgi:CRISPR-associated protein Cmr2
MSYVDPVTGNDVPQGKLKLQWQELAAEWAKGLSTDLAEACRQIFEFLIGEDGGHERVRINAPLCEHALGSYVTDHALLTSAIAYCLGFDQNEEKKEETAEIDLGLLRLAALSHEFPPKVREDIRDGIALDASQRRDLDRTWIIIAKQEKALEQSLQLPDFSMTPPTDPMEQLLFFAHLAASGRLHNTGFKDADGREVFTLKRRIDFGNHPLKQVEERVALVYGGATKIKGYVFESARLPEVRGASALFDRINMEDVPALWGKRIEMSNEITAVVSAPECVVFANGGNFLAFAPVGKAAELADAVEERYSTETLVGNSAAVWNEFSLLELQYGRQPESFWWEDYEAYQNEGHKSLLEAYYTYPAELDPGTDTGCFYQRKAFGELVTVLAGKMMRRRGGWGHEGDRLARHIPQYELSPFAIKCHSCDVRPAVLQDKQADKEYCEPCARKRVVGQKAKRECETNVRWFTDTFFDWSPYAGESWEEQFEAFLSQYQPLKESYYARGQARGWKSAIQVTAARDLGEIGAGSDPKRYVGLIYADGNNVGARVARLSTPAEYRQFSQKLFDATKEAVFQALASHLEPAFVPEANKETRRESSAWVHPFEIITIGGDDLILIVPGSKALDIALSIGERLEEKLGGKLPAEKQPNLYEGQRFRKYALQDHEMSPVRDSWIYEPRISLSAGVVIAHETTPIFFLHDLAQQLLKSAKRWRKEKGLPPYKAGTVDFLALKSVGMVASRLKQFRKQAYELDQNRRLTARPYTWVELRSLLDTVRTLRYQSHFGRSQVYRLQDFLFEGRRSAAVNYLYAFSRLPSEGRRKLARSFNLAWHDKSDVPPWRQRVNQRGVETIWRDLVELYDFVEEGKEE